MTSDNTQTSFGLNMGTETEDGATDEFQEALDWTYESRGSTRERGWERLSSLLRNSVREECWDNAATITGRCQAALKKGSVAEATTAATVLALHVLTLGEPDESGFQSVQPDLVRAAKHGKGAAARCAAVDALSLCCFVMSDDEHSTRAAMDDLRGLWAPAPRAAATGGPSAAALRAAALRGWTFLFTSLNSLPDASAVEALLPALAALLHDGDVEVRAAAGEAIAVVYQTCGLDDLESILEEDEEDEGDEDDDEEEEPAGAGKQQQQQRRPRQQAADGDAGSTGSGVSGLSEVVGRMKDLATNRGDRQRRSKRERASLRGAFREITRVIEDGDVRETKIKLRHGDTLLINTLNGNVCMGYLRRFLAGGFQVHLQSNPLLHAVFGYEPLSERPGRLTALEKRAFRSPSSAASKQRTQQRKGQRAHKGVPGEF